MKITLYLFLIYIFGASFVYGDIKALVGKSFRLHKGETQAYLVEKGIIPKNKIHLLDKFMDRLVVTFMEDCLLVEAWSGVSKQPYEVELDSKRVIIIRARAADGEGWIKTKLFIEDEGYWQETSAFEGYRERFYPYDEEDEEEAE